MKKQKKDLRNTVPISNFISITKSAQPTCAHNKTEPVAAKSETHCFLLVSDRSSAGATFSPPWKFIGKAPKANSTDNQGFQVVDHLYQAQSFYVQGYISVFPEEARTLSASELINLPSGTSLKSFPAASSQ